MKFWKANGYRCVVIFAVIAIAASAGALPFMGTMGHVSCPFV